MLGVLRRRGLTLFSFRGSVGTLPLLILMTFPVYIPIDSLKIHPHLIFETAAYAIAFRIYLVMRKRAGDALDDGNRWWIIAAATMGALVGGLFAVELAKQILGIKRRTGDLFAVPLCLGMAIGRIGCFLTGLEDHTSGIATSLPWGVNFGDGISRHPTQLYEALFALALGGYLWRRMQLPSVPGDIFKGFMVAYFAFRLACDFLKPEVRVLLGLSSIQLACMAMLIYYSADLRRWLSPRDRLLPAAPSPASSH